jgi:hypothetical protein
MSSISDLISSKSYARSFIASCVEFASDFYFGDRYKGLIVGTGPSDFQMFRNLRICPQTR